MTKSFDVFLSHNSKDKPAVLELAQALRARGLEVWLDKWELVPGRPWQEALEDVIETCRSSAVLVGKDGVGPWHAAEMRGCLAEFVRRELPVIPVLLPSAPTEPRLPLFLTQVTWVDLRSGLTEEGLDELQWGITGKKPSRSKPQPSLTAVREEMEATVETRSAPPEGATPEAIAKEQLRQRARAPWGVLAWLGLLSFLGIAVFLLEHFFPRPDESTQQIAASPPAVRGDEVVEADNPKTGTPDTSEPISRNTAPAPMPTDPKTEPAMTDTREPRTDGATFAVPERAAQASTWRDFVFYVLAWEPKASGEDELMAAAWTFKHCISGLEDEPLAAWRQLSRGLDGTSLSDFHTFSSNLRLRGNPSATRMVAVENQGAELLVREIRPQFESRLRGLRTIAGSCCNDHFPFISRARLQEQQENYLAAPSSGGLWAPSGRDSQARSVTNVLQLDTASLDALDLLFFPDGSQISLYDEFAIEPIVEGREKAIDFVGANKEQLRVLQQWQRFIYDGGRTSAAQKIQVKLLSGVSTAPRIFLSERLGQIQLFHPKNVVRPSTDAGRERALPMPLVLDDRTASVVGRNEDTLEKAGGWTGILTLRGGPLKVPYFVHLASQERPREGGRVWTMRLQLPDYTQAQQRLEGVFEITFERPLPEIVPAL